MPAKLKHGVQGAPGGFRVGAGRKPDLFKAKCRELADSPEFFKYAKKVLRGEKVVPHVCVGGVEMTAATPGDVTYLWKELAAYAHGKPVQAVGLDKETTMNILHLVERARSARGLPL